MERRISILHMVLIGVLFLGTVLLGRKPEQTVEHFLKPPPEHIELFHFGFADALADSLWLRWIQDNDTCQTYKSALPLNPLPAQTGDFANPRNKVCDNSWSFKMLDAITKLAPKFETAYLTGSITLSVLVEDYEGAKVIFDRGIAAFPDNWSLLYRAAYHYLFDRHDLPKAAELLTRAQKAGAPDWLVLLAARLYSKAGQLQLGIQTLEAYRKNLTDEKEIARVDQRIGEYRRQLNQ